MPLKIKYQLRGGASNPKRKPRRGYCRCCGAKLTDQRSIERGIGKKCLANNVAIVLEMVPDGNPS